MQSSHDDALLGSHEIERKRAIIGRNCMPLFLFVAGNMKRIDWHGENPTNISAREGIQVNRWGLHPIGNLLHLLPVFDTLLNS